MSERIPMILHCPWCCARHIDRGAFATKPHHTHACQSCGGVWRPAIEATVGVQFLPGFRDGGDADAKPPNPCRCGRLPTAAIDGPWSCGAFACRRLAEEVE